MSQYINSIFTEVASKYDSVNTLSSLGIIVLWRKSAAREAVISKRSYRLLDIATGTGELAIEIDRLARKLGRSVEITAMDFNRGMLSVAARKVRERGLGIKVEQGDAMDLKYKDGQFDVVTSSFALRNVDSLERFAKESYRVLRKGGKFVFMDMGRPDSAISRAVIRAYWLAVSPIGRYADPEAFKWLVESTSKFDKYKFASILRKAGFRNIKIKNEITGAAFMITGNK
ncbi:MAG: ubiquinone/menaquinone biosynthesis methyltransferase [Candidatus Micrarchaeaceae archaeon]